MKRLQAVEKIAPSQNPYWFDETSFGWSSPTSAKAKAVWLSRKDGKTVATLGEYTMFLRSVNTTITATPQNIILMADTRYGGSWLWRWDGERFLANPQAPYTTLEEQIEIREWLDGFRTEHVLPENWLGPFCNLEVKE